MYLRVARTDDVFTAEWSDDDVTYNLFAEVDHALTVNDISIYAGSGHFGTAHRAGRLHLRDWVAH